MIKKIFYIVIIFLFINAGPSAYAGDFAYLTSYASGRHAKLIQMDTTNEAILKRVDMPEDESLDYMVVDEKGGCYLSSYRLADRYGRSIFYYDADSGKLDKFMHLESIFGPKQMAINGDELVVVVEGNDDTKNDSGILFIDRRSKQILRKIFLRENDPTYLQCNIMDSYYDGHKYLCATTFDFIKAENPDQYVRARYGFGNIFVIDVKTREIYKIIDVPREYDTLSGIILVGDKIYVTAQSKGIPTPKKERDINKELLVFSLAKGRMISKIRVSPQPFRLVYDKHSKKVYVLHTDSSEAHNSIEIIDPQTDKVIRIINVPSQSTASMVALNKMYISEGPGFLRTTRTKPKILVINTRTDKAINEIEGTYQNISINHKY